MLRLSRFSHPVRWLIAGIFLLFALPAGSADSTVPESVQHLPATNPYRGVLGQLLAVSAEDRKAIDAWLKARESGKAFALTEAQVELTRQLTSALVAASTAPATTRTDWPVYLSPQDPENLAASTIPEVGLIRTLAGIAANTVDDLPAGEAIQTVAAIARFGREERNGWTILQQLIGVVVEGKAMEAAARRLSTLTPDELRQLGALWDQLEEPPDAADSLSGEYHVYFEPLARNVLLPALKELLARPDQTGWPETVEPRFTRDLRLSGLLDLGDGERRIVLEQVTTGAHISLLIGKPADGMELVGIDFDKRQAIIRCGDREAVIHLESKKIIERSRALARMNQLLPFFPLGEDSSEGRNARAEWLALIRAHPRGVEGYIDDLVETYKRGFDEQLADAERPVSILRSTTPDDPCLSVLMPSFRAIARSLKVSSTQSVMLQAAIHHRLAQLGAAGQSTTVPDPWSDDGSNFGLKPADDGVGFRLSSHYQTRDGQPVTYKFAAPDAGFIRVPAKP